MIGIPYGVIFALTSLVCFSEGLVPALTFRWSGKARARWMIPLIFGCTLWSIGIAILLAPHWRGRAASDAVMLSFLAGSLMILYTNREYIQYRRTQTDAPEVISMIRALRYSRGSNKKDDRN